MLFSLLIVGASAASFTAKVGYYSDDACTSALASDSPMCSAVAGMCAGFENQPGVDSCNASNCKISITLGSGVTQDQCKQYEKVAPGCSGAAGMYQKMSYDCGSSSGGDNKDNKSGGGSTKDNKSEKDGAAALSMIVALVTPFIAML